MAQSFTNSSGTFYIPGATVETKVETPNSGLSTTGVIMLVGEATAGPDVTAETDITNNFFGPDQLAAVVAKYQSGPIVDAFRVAVAAPNDPNIQGGPSRIFIGKTNVSAKASAALTRSGLTNWATVADRNYGEAGNGTTVNVTASTAEVAPTTGAFTFIPSPQASTLSVRTNGSNVNNITIAAKKLPSDLVGTVESTVNTSFNSVVVSSVNNLSATGGLNRGTVDAAMVTSGQTLALAATGNSVLITLNTGSWAVTPTVGDTMIIPLTGEYGAGVDSNIKGATPTNQGAYVVTAVTSSTVTATKLRDNSGTSVTAPENVSAADITAITNVMFFSPITVVNMTGTSRPVLTGLVGQTVTGTASGQTLTLTLQTGAVWNALPKAGDSVLIPSTAPSAWRASNTNGGWYTVTSATSSSLAGGSTIVMTRVSNGAPVSFSATAIAAVTDLYVLRPAIDGTGKSMELYDGGGTESVVTPGLFKNLNTSNVTFLSTSATPVLILSTAEYISSVNTGNTALAISEELLGDGSVVLKVGYHGGGVAAVTGTMTISGTTLTTAVTGGNGSNLSVDLTKYRTLADVATYINSQTGYVASVGSALFGQQATTYIDSANANQTVLDKGTFGIGSPLASSPGRVKKAAWALFNKISLTSLLVQIGTTATLAPTSGQPEVQSLVFLSGGTKGYTTNATISTALDKMQLCRGNFLVPLFSRDATSDITDGLTDSSSTYTIASIHALAKSHVLLMSTVKRRRFRQAFLSYKGSFTNAKLAANDMASGRCSMNFQDFKTTDSSGTVKQFQPWMGAVYAAGMQAAGFYKPIVKKFINTSGVLMADGSFSDQQFSQVEDALQNGLLPAERAETGGYRWISDQTTWAVDNNFVYNSIQAVYAVDTIALTLAQRLENAFVGQSLADVSAGLIVSFVQAIFKDLKLLKLVASSDDAVLGFKNLVVNISGNAATVSVEIKLALGLYFIPITAYITQVQQTATA